MPPDDKDSYFRDKDENENYNEDLFKKYSINREDDDKDDYYDKSDDDYSAKDEDDHAGRDKEDYYKRVEDEKSEEEKLEDEFFSDSDFEVRQYEDEEEGYRSTKTRTRRKKRRLIISTLVIMSILVLVAIGIVFGYRFIKNKYFSETEESSATPEEAIVIPSSMKLGRDMTIVVACAGDNLLEPDINSIMFSKYTGSTSELTSLFIPVNTLFEIPGFGLDSIGQSVEYGGSDLLKLTLKDNIGMDVENYLLIDIINTVNKLESITLNLNEGVTIISDNGSAIDLQQGANIINGQTACSFMKYYSGLNPDVGVSGLKKQELIIDALMKKMVGSSEGEILENLTKISDFIDTDLNLEELSELISTLAALEDDKKDIYTLDGRIEPIDESGNIVFVPDISGLENIFSQVEEVVEETTIEAGETVSVTVLNGCGTAGIAGRTSDLLKGLSFSDGTPRYNIVDISDADNYDYTETQILVKSLDDYVLEAAEHIRGVLLTGNIPTKENSEQKTEIVIIIGKDYDYDAALAGVEQPESTSPETTAGTEGQVSQEADYIINILNGEGTTGLAAKTKEIIDDNFNEEEKVINVKEVKDADNYNYQQTEILIHTDKEGITKIADSIKDVLGVGEISESSDNPDNVDITIILGSDFTE